MRSPARSEPDRAKPKERAGEGEKHDAELSIPLPALRADVSQRERGDHIWQ